MLFKSLALAAVVGTTVAQRPSNTSVCDYYTTALLQNNTAANQLTLLTLLVNTAVIGNYTTPNVGVSVAGILTPGEFNGTAVDLAPYFDGGLASTNTGGDTGASVNFLDGGGATPLKNNTPADSMTSKQYLLLTHLYEYFGTLLGCTLQGADAFPAYSGDASMYEVHKFMDLSPAEVGYFIAQVANSAASFGVSAADIAPVGVALNSLFGQRCSSAATVIPAQGAQLQAICINSECPEASNSTCSAYDDKGVAAEPSTAISSLVPTSTAAVTGSATGTSAASAAASSAATATSSGATTSPTGNSASSIGEMSFAAIAAGVFAMLL